MLKRKRNLEIYDEFIAICKEQFTFLTLDYDYSFSFSSPNLNEATVCSVIFSKKGIAFELLYLNAQECELSVHVNIGNSSFELWELAKVINSDYMLAMGAISIYNKNALEGVIIRIATYLKKNNALICPSESLIEKAHQERVRRNIENSEKELFRKYEEAGTKSQDAFRLKKFEQVIELLKPFENFWKDSDRKRFEISSKRLR